VRVLYLTELFWPYVGGVEVHAASFLPAMRERGYDFRIATSHGRLDLPDEDEWEGFRVHRLPLVGALTARDADATAEALAGLARIKRDFAPDLVHVNLSGATVFFHVRTDRARRAPTLVSVRVSPRGLLTTSGTVLGELFDGAAWVTANSAAVHADLLELTPALAGRSSVVYSGFGEPPPAAPYPGGAFVVGFGRIVRDKGFDVLVEAFARVFASRPDARLVVAGDGGERAALAARARELGVESAVELPGWLETKDIPALLACAAVVVVPSRWREAFGLAALQAGFAGRPVVATDVGGLPEIVEDGATGVLVPPDDAEAVAAAVLTLLDSPERAAALGRRARERALERFSWSAHLDAYDALYRRVAA
jgi:glycogen(starch) synthase